MLSTKNLGENIRYVREMLGVRQEALAEKMGDDWTQKKISLLEKKEEIEPEILDQVANALKVPVDVIKNFSKEAVINVFTNTFNDHSSNQGPMGSGSNNHCTFNPLDKLMEVMEENKKLYERLLQAEREKVEMMEKLIIKK